MTSEEFSPPSRQDAKKRFLYEINPEAKNIQNLTMSKFFVFLRVLCASAGNAEPLLFLVFLCLLLPAIALAQHMDVTPLIINSPPNSVITHSTPIAASRADENIHTPLATAEDQFYQTAFPIKNSHAIPALLLSGLVLCTIFGFFIRGMIRSKPRKIPPQ